MAVALGVVGSLDDAKESDAVETARQNPPSTPDEWRAATDEATRILAAIAAEVASIADALRNDREPIQPPPFDPHIAGGREAARKVLSILHHLITTLSAQAASDAAATTALDPSSGTPGEWRAAQATFLNFTEERLYAISAAYFPNGE